jgi:RNA polymerase sigma-70 factor (ECF subfamily)
VEDGIPAQRAGVHISVSEGTDSISPKAASAPPWRHSGHARESARPRTPVDWKAVVERIRAGDPAGQTTLYETLVSGARLFLMRRLGTQDVDDLVHDLFVTVVAAINRGELREPERLMGFVRTVLNRQLSAEIDRVARLRQRAADLDAGAALPASGPTPEQAAINQQKVAVMKQLLRKLRARDLEVLTRYYLREEPEEQICREVALTPAQFNMAKSRAKARFAKLVNRRLGRLPFSPR